MRSVIGFFAPDDCIVCESEGELICMQCREQNLLPIPTRCYRCKKLSVGNQTCESCRKSSGLSFLWAGTGYDGSAKTLVRKLKFERSVSAAEVMVERIGNVLPYLPDDTLVSHVPTATSRRRSRGYDQAELIARQLAEQKNLKFATLLLRSGQSRQVGADRSQRFRQLEQSFRPTKAAMSLRSTCVLLVDDILTSGATMEAAAKVIKSAGAKRIYGCVFAQKF